ncbi:OmpA family protein [soil metagenome]
MKKNFAIACCFAAISAPALAQTDIKASTINSAYLQDARGAVTRSGAGLCWRSGYWTPADAVTGCDGSVATLAASTEVAVAPAPAIAAEVAAPKPLAPKRCDFAVTLQNEETFDFNKAVLKSEAKKRIDTEVMEKLANCNTLNLVIVTGHTDIIGTQQYNQKLSEKRATVIASYLSSKGISADIDTMGMGKTQQIKACNDKLTQTKLAECLAPNRRVVIEGRGLAK